MAGIFSFYILIYVILDSLEQQFELPFFYDMLAKVLYFSLTFSLTILHHKTAALRSPKYCLSCFFDLCLAPMRTDKIFTFWTSAI